MLLASDRVSTMNEDESHEGSVWMPVSDLMAGLMMLFLLLSVVMMLQARADTELAQQETERVFEVAEEYRDIRNEIHEALANRLGEDRLRDDWKATLDPETLSVEFVSPINATPLFPIQQTRITPYYQAILSEFFPVYLSVLRDFPTAIEEVRVEGHTSSEWSSRANETQKYFRNMALSQGRAKSVLEFIYGTSDGEGDRVWMRQHISAVGLSSSKLVLNSNGSEDKVKSGRVTFRILTNADEQIGRIRRDGAL